MSLGNAKSPRPEPAAAPADWLSGATRVSDSLSFLPIGIRYLLPEVENQYFLAFVQRSSRGLKLCVQFEGWANLRSAQFPLLVRFVVLLWVQKLQGGTLVGLSKLDEGIISTIGYCSKLQLLDTNSGIHF